MIAMGVADGPLWIPLLGAAAAVAIYLMVRPRATQLIQELWHTHEAPDIVKLVAELYIVQIVPAAFMYGLGLCLGWIISLA
ncbi:MAG: hypothetical protein WBQ17_05405 [Rhizomicrobium sp.]